MLPNPLVNSPSVLTLVRTQKRRPSGKSNAALRRLQRKHLKNESVRWFVIELLLFALLAALCAGPMIDAIDAMRLL